MFSNNDKKEIHPCALHFQFYLFIFSQNEMQEN